MNVFNSNLFFLYSNLTNHCELEISLVSFSGFNISKNLFQNAVKFEKEYIHVLVYLE